MKISNVSISPVMVGLHITKCAGTSLISTVRKTFSEDEYCFFSSYYENVLASRPMFSRLFDPDRLRVVFGHYCSELLLRIFEHRQVFLFTGLREPVSRAISEYAQIAAVRFVAGQSPLGVEEYLNTSSNGMCAEVLRCFPTLAETVTGHKWEQALSASSMFDYLYSTENFDQDVQFILGLLDIQPDRLIRDNILAGKSLAEPVRDAINQAEAVIRREAKNFYADDLRLYEELKPFLGAPDLRQAVAETPWAMDRAKFVETLPDVKEATTKFEELETEYLVYEFAGARKLDVLANLLREEIAHQQRILRRIADYGLP